MSKMMCGSVCTFGGACLWSELDFLGRHKFLFAAVFREGED